MSEHADVLLQEKALERLDFIVESDQEPDLAVDIRQRPTGSDCSSSGAAITAVKIALGMTSNSTASTTIEPNLIAAGDQAMT